MVRFVCCTNEREVRWALSELQAYLTYVLKFLGSFSSSLFMLYSPVPRLSSPTTWERGSPRKVQLQHLTLQ